MKKLTQNTLIQEQPIYGHLSVNELRTIRKRAKRFNDKRVIEEIDVYFKPLIDFTPLEERVKYKKWLEGDINRL